MVEYEWFNDMDIEYVIKYYGDKWVACETHINEKLSYYGVGNTPRQAFEELQTQHLDYIVNYLNKEDSNG